MKTITKTIKNDCTCRAKKVEGYDKKFLRRFAPDVCPHFQIRSSATVHASVMCEYMKRAKNSRIKFVKYTISYTTTA